MRTGLRRRPAPHVPSGVGARLPIVSHPPPPPILAAGIKQGVIPGLIHSKFQMVAVDDIGWFAAAAFSNPSEWRGRRVELAGDRLSSADMVAIMERLRPGEKWKVSVPPDFVFKLGIPRAVASLRDFLGACQRRRWRLVGSGGGRMGGWGALVLRGLPAVCHVHNAAARHAFAPAPRREEGYTRGCRRAPRRGAGARARDHDLGSVGDRARLRNEALRAPWHVQCAVVPSVLLDHGSLQIPMALKWPMALKCPSER